MVTNHNDYHMFNKVDTIKNKVWGSMVAASSDSLPLGGSFGPLRPSSPVVLA